MKTVINILAHSDVQPTFERHFEYWHRLAGGRDEDIIVWCPSDKKIRCVGIQILATHKAQHAGIEANARIWSILKHNEGLGADRIAFFEYDSIALEWPKNFDAVGLRGNIFNDHAGFASGQWKSKMFIHPPLFIRENEQRIILPILLREMEALGMNSERGFWDRFLGLALEKSGIPFDNMLAINEGFSANTIQPAQFEDLRKAVLGGATCFHGVKTPECLAVIEDAWKERQSVDFLRGRGYKVER